MRLVDAKYEINDEVRYSYMREYDKILEKMKEIVDNYWNKCFGNISC